MGTYSERRFKHLAGSPIPMANERRRGGTPAGRLSSVPLFKGFLGYPFCWGMLLKGYSISPRAGYGREACMKRVLFALATGLLSTQAFAADLPMPAPPPRAPAAYLPVAPPFSWTGIYIGGNLGAAWNRGTVSDALGT